MTIIVLTIRIQWIPLPIDIAMVPVKKLFDIDSSFYGNIHYTMLHRLTYICCTHIFAVHAYIVPVILSYAF